MTAIDPTIRKIAVDALYQARNDGLVMDEAAEAVAVAVRAAILAPILDLLPESDDVTGETAELVYDLRRAAGVDLPAAGTDVAAVNRVLGVDLWRVRSFRADVRIDFDEQGRVLSVALLNPDPAVGTEADRG